MATDYLLIVPCYNEAKRFQGPLFEKALRDYPNLVFTFVNDGSRDHTEQVLQDFCRAHHERAMVLNLPQNQGKAEAVRQGFLWGFDKSQLRQASPWERSQLHYIGFWDCDLATPFPELALFQEVFAKKTTLQLVMGARVKLLGRTVERQVYRHYLGRIFATAASLVLKLPIYDTQCGAKVFKYDALTASLFDTPFVSRWVFDVEIIARLCQAIQRQGGKVTDAIYELPLRTWQDIGGSKVKASDFFKAFWALLRIASIYRR